MKKLKCSLDIDVKLQMHRFIVLVLYGLLYGPFSLTAAFTFNSSEKKTPSIPSSITNCPRM